MIAIMVADFPYDSNPLLRIDPSDPFVEAPQVNGHKVLDA
jgi:hypothetical protein